MTSFFIGKRRDVIGVISSAFRLHLLNIHFTVCCWFTVLSVNPPTSPNILLLLQPNAKINDNMCCLLNNCTLSPDCPNVVCLMDIHWLFWLIYIVELKAHHTSASPTHPMEEHQIKHLVIYNVSHCMWKRQSTDSNWTIKRDLQATPYWWIQGEYPSELRHS